MGRIILSICALVVALGLAGAASGQQSPQQDQAPNQGEAARDPDAAILALESRMAERERERSANEAYSESQANNIARYDLVAQWWMAVLGLGQLVLTGVGIWYVRETLSETSRAVDETKVATVAMHESNLMQQKAIRAYVSTDAVNLEVRDGHLHGTVLFRNTGQSPALEIHQEIQVAVALTPAGRPFNLPPVEERPNGSSGSLASGVVSRETRVVVDEPFTDEMAQGVRSGTMTIFVRGWVRYNDVFGDTHHTHFCWQRDKQAQEVGFSVRQSSFGNSAD